MSKRVGLGYLASCVLPVLALLVLMLRLLDPFSRIAAGLIYLLGVIALLFAVRRHTRVRTKLSNAKNHALGALNELGLWRKRAAFAFVVFGASLLLFPILLPTESAAFLRESPEVLSAEFDESAEQLRKSEFALTRAHQEFARLAARANLHNRASTDALEAAWARYLDHAVLLDRIVQSHKHFYQLALRSPALADRAFLIGYHAHVVQMNAGYHMARAIDNQAPIEALLNEPNDRLGLPAGTYTSFQRGLTSSESLVRLEAGYGYLKLLRRAERLGEDKLQHLHVYDLARGTILLFGRDPGVLVDAPLDRLEQRAFVAWFPLQKGAAELISPVRTQKRHNFISRSDLQWARERLRAGDVLVQRRNWYLTNLGIPGFWPHAAMYVGTLAELDEEFGPAARGVTLGLPPSQYLEEHMPEVFSALTRLDGEGRAPRVIEAIGEGVVVQPFEVSGHADYMGALRPRLDDEERLLAVLRAFDHYGKPYDYNFEFSTDDAVVCSELVYKALQSEDGESTIAFPLTKQNGRYILPPNDIVRIFDEQLGSAEQQLDFVFFLDGNEALGRATFNDRESFRNSWRRPKWDLVQP